MEYLLFIGARAGTDPNLWRAPLQRLAGPDVELELAALTPPGALPALAHVATPDPELPDLIVTLRGRAADAALDRAADLVRGGFDAPRTSVLAVRRHAILPGTDAVRLVFALARLPRLTLDEFHDYWLNRHAALGRRLIPPYTYHQLHADPAASDGLASRTGLAASRFDGVVEVHFPDLQAFVRQLQRPEVAEEALADEKNFIDHSRSIFWAYDTL